MFNLKPSVCLLALMLPGMMSAESFKVTINRKAQLGTATLQPGDYKITIDGTKAEFKNGKEKVTAEVKQEALPAKAINNSVSYTATAENRIVSIVRSGSMVRWLFP